MDLMLDEMDSYHLKEWVGFFEVEAEEHKRMELASRAEARVKNHKRRGR